MSRNNRSNSQGNGNVSLFDNKATQPSNSVNVQVEKDLYADSNWTKMLNSSRYNRKVKRLVELHKRTSPKGAAALTRKIPKAERVAIHFFANTLPGIGERRARSGGFNTGEVVKVVSTVDTEKFDNTESFQKFRKLAPKTDAISEKVAA